MDQFDKHMQCNQLIFGTNQDELVWSGWPKKVINILVHIFCTKHFNWRKTYDLHLLFQVINENLKNLFHQDFTLDYDCLCGYNYNRTSMDICHMCQLKYSFITDLASISVTFYNISKAGIYKRHQQCPKMCWHISWT